MTIMNLVDQIRARISGLLDGTEGLGAAVLFDCSPDGAVLIDGRQGPIRVSAGQGDADCVITLPTETFRRILDGEMDETTAFMHGEMRISGDIRLATQVSNLMRVRAQSGN